MRQRAADVVHAERERLRTTLTSIGDAVVVTVAHGQVTLMNPVAQRLTGWGDDAVDHPLEEVFRIVNESTRAAVESPVARVIREGTVVGLANHTVLIARDGSELPIDDSGAPIRDGRGRIVGVVLVFRDVTERRRSERTMQEADRRKDEFLAMLAHELRNPLAPISNANELLAKILSVPDPRVESAIATTKRQVAQLRRLVDDLLDVSRVTQGRIELQRRPIELSHIIVPALEAVQPMLREKRHRLVAVESTEHPALYVNADPARLMQCLVNVLTNAAKYTDAGGEITVQTRAEGATAV